MKKFLLSCLLIFMMATSVYGEKSAIQTADASIKTGGGRFLGVLVTTDGANSLTLTFYDNTAGSGTKIIPTITVSATPQVFTLGFDAVDNVNFYIGIYADITITGGGSASYQVYWLND